jgi:hypothetical protein
VPAEIPLVYSQTPRPVGFPVTYKLFGDRLVVDTLKRIDEISLRNVEQVRLTYEPGRLSRGFYKTVVRWRDGRSVSLGSVSWSSLISNTDQGPAYGAFVAALIAAIGHASPRARLKAGKPRFVWSVMAAVSAALAVAVVFTAARALASGSPVGAVVPLALGAVMAWQMGPVVWLNRPRSFTPEALPDDLLGGAVTPAASGSGPRGRRARAGP